MGKKLNSQRRGKGSSTYTSSGKNYSVKINSFFELNKNEKYYVKDIIHKGKNYPIFLISNGKKKFYFPAIENILIFQEINFLGKIDFSKVNIVFLKDLNIGEIISNICPENNKKIYFCRSSGSFGIVREKMNNGKVLIELRSGKKREFVNNSLCYIGKIAGEGKNFKPLLKSGNKFFKLKRKAKKNVRTSGISKNAVDHPFGGGNHARVKKNSSVSYGTPPGRKVGRFGKRKGKKKKS